MQGSDTRGLVWVIMNSKYLLDIQVEMGKKMHVELRERCRLDVWV